MTKIRAEGGWCDDAAPPSSPRRQRWRASRAGLGSGGGPLAGSRARSGGCEAGCSLTGVVGGELAFYSSACCATLACAARPACRGCPAAGRRWSHLPRHRRTRGCRAPCQRTARPPPPPQRRRAALRTFQLTAEGRMRASGGRRRKPRRPRRQRTRRVPRRPRRATKKTTRPLKPRSPILAMYVCASVVAHCVREERGRGPSPSPELAPPLRNIDARDTTLSRASRDIHMSRAAHAPLTRRA